jgi:hypothetical protein
MQKKTVFNKNIFFAFLPRISALFNHCRSSFPYKRMRYTNTTRRYVVSCRLCPGENVPLKVIFLPIAFTLAEDCNKAITRAHKIGDFPLSDRVEHQTSDHGWNELFNK